METILSPVFFARKFVNAAFADKEPWQITAITASTILFAVWIRDCFDDQESISTQIKNTFFKYVKKIPKVKAKIEKEEKIYKKRFQKAVVKRNKGLPYITKLPKDKCSNENIVNLLQTYLGLGDVDIYNGMLSGGVYCDNREFKELLKEVYGLTSYTNPLHPDVFPGVCKMEAEVLRMAINLFHGDQECCGAMTTGGTESILMACKAYRDYAYHERGIKRPEMVIPITAHSAFDKAGQYFKIKIVRVPMDPVTAQVDVKAMKRAISSRTIMLVGSAPNFPYGTFDNIADIAELGEYYNVPVHVDSCLGGFLTIFMDKAGYPVPITDFRLPGVTSISADTHKYAYAPKGTSIILYKDIKYLHYQYTATTDWPGGMYASPAVNGSRNGGSIAACWATLLSNGEDEYVRITREVIRTRQYIEKGLRRLEGIHVIGQPVTSVIAVGSHVFDIFRLVSILSDKGWNLNTLQFPSAFHFCITQIHTKDGLADKFLQDVQEALKEVLKEPSLPANGKMAIYGFSQTIPDRSIVGQLTKYFLDALQYIPTSDNDDDNV